MSFDWQNERVVPDTNFLVSALLFESSWPQIALKVIAENGTLLCSDETLAELTEVFARPKFDPFCARKSRIAMLYDIIKIMEKIQVTANVTACRDPKNDKFLSLALAGDARVIVSGDKDLLVLHPFRGIKILSPRDYITVD